MSEKQSILKTLMVVLLLALFLAGCEQGGNQSASAAGGSVGDWRDPRPEDGERPAESEPSVGRPAQGSSGSGEVRELPGGGYEILGVPTYRQSGTDHHSTDGSNGWRDWAYCGPTSLQMVMSHYGVDRSRDYWGLTHPESGEEIRSGEFRGQVYIRGQGATYPPMVEMAKNHGMANSEYRNPASMDDLRSAVEAGRPQIISIGRNGRIQFDGGPSWETQGHVVVVTGVKGNGDVIVNDPGSGQRQVITASEFRSTWKGFTVDIAR